ncbi:MAG: hypothetical protein ACRD68_00385, partial [Pyrinomonadaceae bacterium]
EKKLATLVELEAVTAIQTISAIANFPFAVFEKGLDLLAGRGRTLSERERRARRPAEHHAAGAEGGTDSGDTSA